MDLEVRFAFRRPPIPHMPAMDSISDTARRILEIEARQDEALRELEALERRLEQVLAEYLLTQAGSVTPLCNRHNDAA